jgi:hypothetical protein
MKIQLLGTGVAVLLLNVTLLSMLATGAVEGAVDDKFATFPLDEACEDTACTTMKADWTTSTTSRDYYAYDLTNSAAVLAGSAEPAYEKMGPFTYDITTERQLIAHDGTAGTLQYRETKSFACASDSATPCDTAITQVNIGFRPQVIGATGTYIDGAMGIAKIGFAVGMLDQDLNTTQGGTATAASVCTAAGVAIPCSNWATGAWGLWALTPDGIGVLTANGYDNSNIPNFASDTLDKAMDNTTHPADPSFNISLTNPLGPLAFFGMGYPSMSVAGMSADPVNSTSIQRATVYDYMAYAPIDHDANVSTPDVMAPDYPEIFARDWAVFAGVGGGLEATHASTHFSNSEPAQMNDNISARLQNLLGVDFSTVNNINLLLNGTGTDAPLGLLASNAAGTSFGLASFLQLDAVTAMTNFGLSAEQYGALMVWAGGWATSATSLQLGLLGGTGTLNAEQFVNASFGGPDPVQNNHISVGVNLGGLYAMQNQGYYASFNSSVSANILYGPLGLTTQTGAVLFQYGMLSGNTPPIDFTTMGPGAPMPWVNQTVAALYGVSVTDADVLMNYVHVMSNQATPMFLKDTFGTTEYLTQSVDSWLFGWHDPVNAFLATGNPFDTSVGWSSLETNKTYFGSGGILNGDGTTYTICTGEVSTCDKGETLLEDGSAELSWHNTAMTTATFGLIGVESLAGTTGGFLTGTGDKVDLSGYGVADITCTGTSTLKGIPTDTCTASMDPTTRSIQAKLMKTYTLLDATPSALPVYFGSEVSLEAEQLSGLIIAGSSTSTFYLDTRANGNMATAPAATDLVPVFQIVSSSTIEDSDAEDMESAIVQNQDMISYWMNLDSPIDYVAILLYIGGVALIIMHFVANKDDEEGFEAQPAESESEDSEPAE